VLAGGSGTRFWPLSTPTLPKQFLPLSSGTPLLVEAVERLDGLIPPGRILVITGRTLADQTRRMLPGIPSANVLGEPRAASTGPALAWATSVAAERDAAATVLAMHADWWVGDAEAFRRSASLALETAEARDALVTVGIVPARPDVGYGYIEKAESLGPDVWAVSRFTEKPDEVNATRLIEAGALWNSGLFAWTARRFFAEAESHAPEMAPHLSLLRRGDPAGFFAAVTPIAVDVALFERSRRVVVAAGRFPWDDVGTWPALARVRSRDAAGNVVVGDAFLRDATDTIAWGDDGPVVVDGVHGLVVVRARGRVLVTTRERAARLKDLLDAMPARVRESQ
jgi:mannose-1-phosphate guanylyltransferase